MIIRLISASEKGRITAAKAIDGELVSKKKDGSDELRDVFTHTVASHYIPNLLVKAGVYDTDGNEITPAVFVGPALLLKFVGAKKGKTFTLPPNAVSATGLIKWFGD